MSAEQIIAKLREAEIELARGEKVGEAAKRIGVTEQTSYRWKKEYGGLRVDRAKRLKDLEKENAGLKRLLADAELDKAILREAATGNFRARRSGVGRSSMFVGLAAESACRSVGPVICWGNRAPRSDAFGKSLPPLSIAFASRSLRAICSGL